MTTALSVTIDRTALSLSPLVIPGTPTTDNPFWIPQDGIGRPDFSMRLGYAPDSRWVPGKYLLDAVLEASSLPLAVQIDRVANIAALQVARRELEAAVSQFTYTLTLTVGGEDESWQADPTWPAWGSLRHEYVDVLLDRAEIVIPLNPA